MSGNNININLKFKYYLIVFVLILILSCCFLSYFNIERKSLEKDSKIHLKAISDMKIVQLEAWMNERISDGKFIKSSVIQINFLKDTSNEEIIADLKKRLSNAEGDGA